MYQFHKALLLVVSIGDGLPLSIRHTQCLECSVRAVEAWFARNIGLVHCGREATRFSETLKSFTPGALVRRRKQDPVNIENARSQRMRTVGPWSRQFEGGHKVNTVRKKHHTIRPKAE